MPVLEARALTVRFGEHIAVRDVDLAVDAGTIVGLIGPNGAGKTTTFNAISGVQRCTGSVLLDGVDISSAPPHRRARLGMNRTFQRLEVFGSMTALGQHPDRRRDRGAGTAPVDAGRHGDRRPHHRAAGALGRRRTVEPTPCPPARPAWSSSGRALATEPKVVLLDEPASGLDEVETARLAEVLTSLAADGMAILLVEHDMELVMQLCSRICVLNLGEVIAMGDPAHVRADAGVRAAYLGDAA